MSEILSRLFWYRQRYTFLSRIPAGRQVRKPHLIQLNTRKAREVAVPDQKSYWNERRLLSLRHAKTECICSATLSRKWRFRLYLIASAEGRWGLCQPRCAKDTMICTMAKPGNTYRGLYIKVSGMLEVAEALWTRMVPKEWIDIEYI